MTAFDRAWGVAKARTPAYPIGKYDGKRVAMFGGKPYYQSSGTSGKTKKREGGWYGFAGIDPDDKFGMGRDWWIKGEHPDISDHTRVSEGTFDEKLGREIREMDVRGQVLGDWLDDNSDWIKWDDIDSSKTLNERLAGHGWEAPV